MENFCESYHLPWVHPGLNQYSKLEDHYDIIEPGSFSGQGTRVYDPAVQLPTAPSLRDELPAHWHKRAEYVSLFPNLLLGVHVDHFLALLLTPKGVGTTEEEMRLYCFHPDALEPAFDEQRRFNCAQWMEVFEEDVELVEGMQRGRHSPGFDGGVFTEEMCEANAAFHDWAHARIRG